MCPPFSDPDQRLFVRNATRVDIPGIIPLSRRVCEGTGMHGCASRHDPEGDRL